MINKSPTLARRAAEPLTEIMPEPRSPMRPAWKTRAKIASACSASASRISPSCSLAKRWRAWTHKDGLGADNPNKLLASPNTGLGTRSRHDLGLLTQDGAPSYNPNYVFCVLVAADQSVWAGTWGGGVSRFDGKKWTNYTAKDGLAGDIVYSMAQDAKGDMWFGTSNGLTHFNGKTWRSINLHTGLLDNNVYALAVAPNGDIWAGTKRGVARLGLTKRK